YGDANDNNILLTVDTFDPKVVAFFDFGDAVYSARIHELAIGLAYFMMDQADPIWAACIVIRAYHNVTSLSELEVRILL
ncbi:MAG: phosphotransferase, partial [Bacteroidota bacterium]